MRYFTQLPHRALSTSATLLVAVASLWAAGCNRADTEERIVDQQEEINELEQDLAELQETKDVRIEKAAQAARKDAREDIQEEVSDVQEELLEAQKKLAALQTRRQTEQRIEERLANLSQELEALRASQNEKQQQVDWQALTQQRELAHEAFLKLQKSSGDDWAERQAEADRHVEGLAALIARAEAALSADTAEAVPATQTGTGAPTEVTQPVPEQSATDRSDRAPTENNK